MSQVIDPRQNGVPPNDMRVAIELEIPSDVRYIERIVDLVSRQCQDFAFPPSVCRLNVPVALSEALPNAILRGNGHDHRKHVRVRASVDRVRLVLDVIDEGEGFDFDACMDDPTLPENLDREDGRGLFLMQQLMDRVERFQDSGNVVRLTLSRA
jgi:serine/threonine-protein kinase RsbW